MAVTQNFCTCSQHMFRDDLCVHCLGQRIGQVVFRRYFMDGNFSTRNFLLYPQLRDLDVPHFADAEPAADADRCTRVRFDRKGFSNLIPISAARDLMPRATLAAFTIA